MEIQYKFKDERRNENVKKKSILEEKRVKWYKEETQKGSEVKTPISRSKGYETSFKIRR